MSDLRTVTDQMGRKVTFSYPPKRILSLVPSQTELLLDIGAPVIGRTKFCTHPKEQLKDISVVGGTKKFRFDKIRKLQPDLVIGNKEENYKEGILELGKEYPVWMSDIFDLDDAFDMMKAVGLLSGRETQAQPIIDECKQAIQSVQDKFCGRVIYFIWKSPWMAAGKNTFIDVLLKHLGYTNLVNENRYPELSIGEISSLKPDRILLSSEPFPFKEKHLQETTKLWPDIDIQLVDGELYSWYGSRMKHWR